jgi:hypothetical protein
MKTLKRLAAFALTLLAVSLPAAGEVRDLVFGSLPTGDWFDPSIGSGVARLADGSYAVVWQGMSPQEARMQWVRPDGSEVLEPGGRPLPRPTDGDFPVVAADSVAGAFVAYVARTTQGSRVVVQSFDGDASPRWAPGGVLPLDSPAREDQRSPQLLASPGGGVFVCFTRSTDPALVTTVCQRLGADGRPLWPGGRAMGGRPGRSFAPRLVADDRGGLFVFRSSARLLTLGGHVYSSLFVEGQRFSAGGLPLWGIHGKQLHATNGIYQSFFFSRVFAVSDGQGGAILAFGNWTGKRDDPQTGVLAQRFDRDGEPRWGKGVELASGRSIPTADSLAAAPDDGAFVVVLDPLYNSQTRLLLYRVGPGGRLLRPAQGLVLSAPDRFQTDGNSQASFDDGRLRVLWTSHVLGNPFHVEVRIAVFDRAGRRLSAPDAGPLAPWGPGEFHYFEGFAFDPERNQGLAVWNTWRAQASFLAINAEGALFSGDVGTP